MPYQEETIKTIVDRLNTQYFLPSIQRHYVWKPDQIILLFDSIMRGYPISSFLFWELKQENRGNWEVYKFAEVGNSEGTNHEKLASKADGIQNLTLVLDGQQRLTSMQIGLKGKYKVRKNINLKMTEIIFQNTGFIWIYLKILHQKMITRNSPESLIMALSFSKKNP